MTRKGMRKPGAVHTPHRSLVRHQCQFPRPFGLLGGLRSHLLLAPGSPFQTQHLGLSVLLHIQSGPWDRAPVLHSDWDRNEESTGIGNCVTGGMNQTPYREIWEKGPSARGHPDFSHSSTPLLPYRSPKTLLDWTSSRKCSHSHNQ